MKDKEGKTKKENDVINWIVPMLLGMITILLVVLLIFAINGKEGKSSTNNSTNQGQITHDIDDDEDNHEIQTDTTYISKEKALSIALESAKLSQNDIYDISVEFDYKYGKTVYEIDFDYQRYEYEYYIDAASGEILHSFKERND